ncbi:MAG: hypothetical protein HQL24_01290 [Candidatus Omnitrophica bacterium]|nr:hypothetical protein [Candidatus Omnitrophota bacterium]
MMLEQFMNKVRYWDNLIAKWVMRHFYFMFFQVILVIISIFWLSNTIHVIDLNFQTAKASLLEKVLLAQTINTTIIVLLLLLNSFWLLYIFGGIQRLRTILRDITYHLSKMRCKN